MLVIGQSPGKGRGIFALSTIDKGVCIEQAPVIVIPEDEIIHIRRTVFYNYFFKWGETLKDAAIALGYGSLFNHSYQPNAMFKLRLDQLYIDFITLKPIQPGEEITVNYNGDPADQSRLWFKTVE